MKNLSLLLSFAAKCPTIPIRMDYKTSNIDALIDEARECREQIERIVKITNELSEKYSDNSFDI